MEGRGSCVYAFSCVFALGFAIAGCANVTVETYRQQFHEKGLYESPSLTKMDAKVAILVNLEDDAGGVYERAQVQAIAADLGTLFANPAFARGGSEDFVLEVTVSYERFWENRVKLTATLTNLRTGAHVQFSQRSQAIRPFSGPSQKEVYEEVMMPIKTNVALALQGSATTESQAALGAVPEKPRGPSPAAQKELSDLNAESASNDPQIALKALRTLIQLEPGQPAPLARAAAVLLALCDPSSARDVALMGSKYKDRTDLERYLAAARKQENEVGSFSPGGASTQTPDDLSANPDPRGCRAQTLNREGVELARAGQTKSALVKFDEAVVTSPGPLPKADYNAALVMDRLGQASEALSRYQKAFISLLAFDDQEEAVRRMVDLTHRANINVPDDVDRRYRLGIVRAEEKRYSEATENFEGTLNEVPWLVDAYYNIAIAYDLTGRPDKSLYYMRMYRRLRPEAPNIGQIKTKIIELEDRLGVVGVIGD